VLWITGSGLFRAFKVVLGWQSSSNIRDYRVRVILELLKFALGYDSGMLNILDNRVSVLELLKYSGLQG